MQASIGETQTKATALLDGRFEKKQNVELVQELECVRVQLTATVAELDHLRARAERAELERDLMAAIRYWQLGMTPFRLLGMTGAFSFATFLEECAQRGRAICERAALPGELDPQPPRKPGSFLHRWGRRLAQ